MIKSSSGKKGITFIEINGSSFLSYKDLYDKSLSISGYLCEKVNPPDNEIIILLDNNKEFVPVFWACIAAKIKAVPVAVGGSDEHKLKLFKVWENLTSPYLLTSSRVYENLRGFAEQKGLQKIFGEIEGKLILNENIGITDSNKVKRINENEIAFIQYSSGSTGIPKGVILTHKNLVVTISAFINAVKINSKDSFLSWFPLTHDMGLIGWHIVPLFAGLNQTLIETNLFVRRPALWLDIAHEHKSTILCSPNFGLKHFLGFTKKLNDAEWDLSNVRIITNGAEPISPKLCEDFLKTLVPYGLKHRTMSPGYGLAEVGLIASISDYRTNFETLHLNRKRLNIGERISETDESSADCLSFVSEGEFIPELSVKVTNDTGTELPEEYVGHICLKGESVTGGYYNNNKATKQAIKKRWLDTGDLGFIKNNKLYLTGRSKELIIINGYNYYPHDIERVCLTIEGLDLGRVVAVGTFEKSIDQEALIIFVYYKNEIEKFIELSLKIKEEVLKSVGLNVFKVIPVKKIPKTTSGKVQRFVLLENYKKGKFNDDILKIESIQNKKEGSITEEVTYEFVIEKLKSLLNKVININEFNSNETLANYGIDSIRGTELLGNIKDFFNIEYDDFIYLPDLSLVSIAEVVLKNIGLNKFPVKEQKDEPFSNLGGTLYRASAGQFSIYYHYKNHPLSSAYNISIACRILNKINFNKLKKAYNFVLNRHEILRAKFYMTDNLYYKVDEKVSKAIEVVNTRENRFDNLKTLVKERTETPFDIENDSVIRAFLYQTKNAGVIFVINMHHIAGDARSLFILLNEILTCYNELDKDDIIKSLPQNSGCRYSEYVNEEIKYLNGNSVGIAKEYWAANLSGSDFGLNLPKVVKDGKQNKASSIMFEVELKKNQQLKNVSDFTFMFSIYCYLLHRYTRQNEIIVGVPVSDNKVISNKKTNEELIGYTVHTLPIKSTLNDSETVSTYLERIKLTILSAMKHQHYPLAKITDDINPFRYNDDNLFHTMFTALPVGSANKLSELTDSLNEESEIEFAELLLKPFYISQQENLFDLSMEMVEHNEKFIFRVSYNCSRYSKDFVERFINHYKKVVEEFASYSSTKLSNIEILSSEEKQLLESFNETEKEFENYKPIINLIEEQSFITPGNVAYIFNDKNYTYEWINGKANGLANQLLKSGINKGSFIPVFMKKGIDLPVSVLGIMKAGCAFIPLDVDAPQRRLNLIINDINPKIILTTKENLEKLTFIDSSKIICVEVENIKEINKNPNIKISLDDPIYGIYTSGTTGIPKCAINLHKGITNKFKFMDDYFGIDEQRIVFHGANYIFDTSVYQLFWSLTHGAKVVIPVSTEKLNLDNMLDLVKKHQVTFIELVPSVFNILVEYFENNLEAENKFRSITDLSFGGETIVPSFINRFRRYFPEVKITNIYGPAETAIGITYYNINENIDEIPIGKPMSNAQIFILDQNMNRTPIGITGEIYIGGECVGLGYLNHSDKTASVFVDDPFEGKGKLYKTGDLGCYRHDGNILFKGRADEQLKIRGVRIEPDEIRANILKVDFVRDAAIVAIENNNNETQLAAYIVLKNEKHNAQEIKNELLKSLPEILIPQYFIKIDELPLNANGKLNKRALPEINFTNYGFEENIPAHSSKLLNIWCEVLGRENINVNDKFFNCGGNSLKALLLKIKIQQSYGIEFSIEKILNNPSISQLEKLLAKLSPEEENFIPKVEAREYYPLSNQQKRMWLVCNEESASKAYGMIGVFHIKGKVDLPVMRKSWLMLVERHESLRTKYKVINGEPVQVIDEKGFLNHSDIQTCNINSELQNIIESVKKHSFDLSVLPLFRIITISDDKENTKLLLHFHHIITDGWSTKKMFDELSIIYNNYVENLTPVLKELPIQYKDYSEWFRKEIESKNFKEAEDYWNKKLSGAVTITSMPVDYDIVKLKNKTAGLKRFFISKELTNKASEFGNHKEITMFMLLVSAVEIVLSKYTNSEDIILGTPVSGRNRPEIEEQLGLYVNTIVLKNKVEKEKEYSLFIHELKKEILESYKYQDYPYDKLVEAKNAKKASDLFEVFVSYESREDEAKLELNGAETVYEEIGNESGKFNINVMFKEKSNGIEFIIEYTKELYKEERVSLFGEHIKKALEEIIRDPNKKIKSINILSKAEELRLLKNSYTSTGQDIRWKSVVEQFKDVVKENEHVISLFHLNKSLTYKQLDIDSDKVASALKVKGIKDECIVGLLTSKSVDMIVGMIGILKAGAAYLPLDSEHPVERLKMIIKESKSKVILTNVQNYLKGTFGCDVLDMNEIKASVSTNISPQKNKPSQLAYVIYTSGSTGTPKGVMIEHHSLSNLIKSLRQEVYNNYGKGLNVALQASYVFDASIQQIFPALMRGDTLHLIDDETKLDGKLTTEYFEKYKIDIADATPTLFDLQLRSGFALGKNSSLKHLLIGGETLKYELIKRFYSNSKSEAVKITNMYGPSECCVDTVCFTIAKYDCKESGIAPIGKPMFNTGAYILDDNYQLVPEGIAGELYLEGENVGRGYLNNEELTDSKFIKSPFDKNKIIYRTGDLCCYSYDGNIIYLGRVDNQIKIRGYRVELGEIENVIDHFIKPAKCAVIFDKNEDELIAIIEKGNNDNIGADEVFVKLRQQLPVYMCPSKIIEIEKLPLTSSGKADKNKLHSSIKEYAAISLKKNYEAPRNKAESKLVNIWKEVLAIDDIGISDNFYELGGHSLKSLKIMSAVVKEFDVDVNYRDILVNPTIKELALVIEVKTEKKYQPIPKVEEKEYYELSHAQKRLWLECELGRSAAYNIVGGFRLLGEMDFETLFKSFNKLFSRHESLRTRFVMAEGQPKQIISESKEAIVKFVDFSSSENSQELLGEEIKKNAAKSLNIFKDDLVNISLIKTKAKEYYLIALLHHIVTDGWSIKIMLDELSRIYNGYKSGTEPALNELAFQYKDYSVWFNKKVESINFEKAKNYWDKKLSGDLPFITIQADSNLPQLNNKFGKVKRFKFDEELTKEIHEFISLKEVTAFMFMISAVEIVLHKYTGSEDIILGTPVSGRNHPDLGKQLGLYTNTIVLRNKVEKDKKYLEFLNNLKSEIVEAYNYQDYPFDKLMENKRGRNNKALFNMFVSYETEEDKIQLNLNGLQSKYEEIETGTSKFDISTTFRERKDIIEYIVEYSADLYKEETIKKFAADIEKVIEGIIVNNDQTIQLINIDFNKEDVETYQKREVNKKLYAGSKSIKYRAPKTSLEKEIALLWKDVLCIKRAGVEDNFFELGGQSIKALQLATLLKEKYNINLELKFVFTYQTIVEQAKEIDNIIWINSDEAGENEEEIIL